MQLWDKLPVPWPRRCGGLRVSAVRLGFRCSVCQCGKAFPPAQDGHQTIRGQWVNSTSFYLESTKCLSNLWLLSLPYDSSSLAIHPQINNQSIYKKKLCNYTLFFGSCCSFQMIVYFPENMHIFQLCLLFCRVYNIVFIGYHNYFNILHLPVNKTNPVSNALKNYYHHSLMISHHILPKVLFWRIGT